MSTDLSDADRVRRAIAKCRACHPAKLGGELRICAVHGPMIAALLTPKENDGAASDGAQR